MIDSPYDTNNLVDINNDDVYVSLSCYEIHNIDPDDISKGEPHIEDDKIGCFENHTKGIGSKLMNKMDFDGKHLGKNGQGILKHIQTCIRKINECLGYEG